MAWRLFVAPLLTRLNRAEGEEVVFFGLLKATTAFPPPLQPLMLLFPLAVAPLVADDDDDVSSGGGFDRTVTADDELRALSLDAADTV
jgi:hypothetical protein